MSRPFLVGPSLQVKRPSWNQGSRTQCGIRILVQVEQEHSTIGHGKDVVEGMMNGSGRRGQARPRLTHWYDIELHTSFLHLTFADLDISIMTPLARLLSISFSDALNNLKGREERGHIPDVEQPGHTIPYWTKALLLPPRRPHCT